MRFLFAAFLIVLGLAQGNPATAAPYEVDHAVSRIEFGGTHAGTPFSGTFDTWGAVIDFDPAAPEKAVIQATIDLTSANTGNKMFDSTLPSADWFDTKNHPKAVFIGKTFAANPDGSYQATGDLRIRGVSRPVTFSFRLDQPEAATVSASASFSIDRLDFDIGRKSDEKAEWVSQSIDLTLKITARKKS
jgi:cytochrome b561